jgi:two-component system, response regulator PdtaR
MKQQGSQTAKATTADRDDGAAHPPPLRVLIVEDEAIIAMEIEMMLENMGIEVLGVAMSAAQAADLARAYRPDCVTMDINLKGDRDGVSAALEIHEELGIRAIFVSAYGNPEIKERAQPARPLGWVQKPIRPAELVEAIAQVRAGA